VARIERLLYIAEYKRRQAPPGVKLGSRNFGRDRRYPITNAPHWLVIPCLFFTLMLGPIGLLLYFAVRMVHGRLAGQSSI
jgi:hypothetical protein